jgi:hypothetical protein
MDVLSVTSLGENVGGIRAMCPCQIGISTMVGSPLSSESAAWCHISKHGGFVQ